ncbi:hypothetical protein AAAV93_13545 [[Ruminococcus] lactaris]|uniref:hypothetical protein n=1 Tax=Clostridia TaxID=186801 RepID=UPI00241ED129|nr:hypothetical protein [[Ruminococcus] lactaris]
MKIINEKSTNRRFRKQATMIAGMSAMVVTKMELQRLKEKLPNISIRYTGTGKDSLKFGVGMATTAAGIILALLGGGSEILTGGVSTAISVPAAASGIAIAGTGLAISGSALAKMFDVRIQKSESSKGNGDGKNSQENANSSEWNKGSFDSSQESLDYHFNKHGEEVGAKNTEQYLRKAEEFAKNAKKGSTKSRVRGEVEGVIRYKKNGKYIDIAPDGSIVLFGKQ